MDAWRPRVFEVFLQPTCPFSVRAFGKLEDLLDKAGEDCITRPKVRLQSAASAHLLGRDRALHSGRLDPRRRKGGHEIRRELQLEAGDKDGTLISQAAADPVGVDMDRVVSTMRAIEDIEAGRLAASPDL
jgi:hypothetical protein